MSLSFLFSHKMTGSSLESDQYREQTFSREQRVNLQMLETRLRADRPQWAYQHRLAHHVFVFGFDSDDIYLHYCFVVCLRANRLFPNVRFLLRGNLRSD